MNLGMFSKLGCFWSRPISRSIQHGPDVLLDVSDRTKFRTFWYKPFVSMDIFDKIKCPLTLFLLGRSGEKILGVGGCWPWEIRQIQMLNLIRNCQICQMLKCSLYVQKVKDSVLENYESYTGHFTSIKFLSYYYFSGQVLQGISERR